MHSQGRNEAETPSKHHAGVFQLAAAFALFFGTLEAAETAAFRFVPWVQPFEKVSLDVFWAAPVVHILANMLAAAVVWFAWRIGIPSPPRLAPTVFAFMGTFGVVAYTGVLGRNSSLVLSAGIAVQLGRLWVNHGSRLLVRRAGIGVGAFVVIATLVLRASEAWPVLWDNAVPAGPSAPNVLIVVLDTVRADHLSAYGYSGKATPTIERLASEGTLFEMANGTSSWTLPSHASLLTGLSQSQHGAESTGKHLTGAHELLQENLLRRGYATGAFVANNVFVVPELGFGTAFQRFDVHDWRSLLARTTYGRLAKRVARKRLIEIAPLRSAAEINSRFEQWRESLHDRPFFAMLNYMDAHEPYHPGDRPPNLRVWDRRRSRSADENLLLQTDYDDAIARIDAELGRLIARAQQQKWWDKTLVILTADHGEAITKGIFDHGFDLTLDQIHVPLILRYPGTIPAGLRVAAPVTIADIPATIETTIEPGEAPSLPGKSLARWYSASTPAPEPAGVLAELTDPQRKPIQNLKSIVLDGYQYIYNVETGQERLFLLDDVVGEHDLSAGSRGIEVIQRMREALRLHQLPIKKP